MQGSSWRWEPQVADFTWLEIPKQAVPKTARRARRTQLSIIARKFEATEVYRGTQKLELMPQPIHWYEDESKGVLDGAVFVLAHGTNAEILLFIEAQRKEGGDPRWVAGFSRLGSAKLDVTFADARFWSKPASGGNSKRAYFYRSEELTEEEQAVFRPN